METVLGPTVTALTVTRDNADINESSFKIESDTTAPIATGQRLITMSDEYESETHIARRPSTLSRGVGVSVGTVSTAKALSNSLGTSYYSHKRAFDTILTSAGSTTDTGAMDANNVIVNGSVANPLPPMRVMWVDCSGGSTLGLFQPQSSEPAESASCTPSDCERDESDSMRALVAAVLAIATGDNTHSDRAGSGDDAAAEEWMRFKFTEAISALTQHMSAQHPVEQTSDDVRTTQNKTTVLRAALGADAGADSACDGGFVVNALKAWEKAHVAVVASAAAATAATATGSATSVVPTIDTAIEASEHDALISAYLPCTVPLPAQKQNRVPRVSVGSAAAATATMTDRNTSASATEPSTAEPGNSNPKLSTEKADTSPDHVHMDNDNGTEMKSGRDGNEEEDEDDDDDHILAKVVAGASQAKRGQTGAQSQVRQSQAALAAASQHSMMSQSQFTNVRSQQPQSQEGGQSHWSQRHSQQHPQRSGSEVDHDREQEHDDRERDQETQRLQRLVLWQQQQQEQHQQLLRDRKARRRSGLSEKLSRDDKSDRGGASGPHKIPGQSDTIASHGQVSPGRFSHRAHGSPSADTKAAAMDMTDGGDDPDGSGTDSDNDTAAVVRVEADAAVASFDEITFPKADAASPNVSADRRLANERLTAATAAVTVASKVGLLTVTPEELLTQSSLYLDSKTASGTASSDLATDLFNAATAAATAAGIDASLESVSFPASMSVRDNDRPKARAGSAAGGDDQERGKRVLDAWRHSFESQAAAKVKPTIPLHLAATVATFVHSPTSAVKSEPVDAAGLLASYDDDESNNVIISPVSATSTPVTQTPALHQHPDSDVIAIDDETNNEISLSLTSPVPRNASTPRGSTAPAGITRWSTTGGDDDGSDVVIDDEGAIDISLDINDDNVINNNMTSPKAAFAMTDSDGVANNNANTANGDADEDLALEVTPLASAETTTAALANPIDVTASADSAAFELSQSESLLLSQSESALLSQSAAQSSREEARLRQEQQRLWRQQQQQHEMQQQQQPKAKRGSPRSVKVKPTRSNPILSAFLHVQSVPSQQASVGANMNRGAVTVNRERGRERLVQLASPEPLSAEAAALTTRSRVIANTRAGAGASAHASSAQLELEQEQSLGGDLEGSVEYGEGQEEDVPLVRLHTTVTAGTRDLTQDMAAVTSFLSQHSLQQHQSHSGGASASASASLLSQQQQQSRSLSWSLSMSQRMLSQQQSGTHLSPAQRQTVLSMTVERSAAAVAREVKSRSDAKPPQLSPQLQSQRQHATLLSQRQSSNNSASAYDNGSKTAGLHVLSQALYLPPRPRVPAAGSASTAPQTTRTSSNGGAVEQLLSQSKTLLSQQQAQQLIMSQEHARQQQEAQLSQSRSGGSDLLGSDSESGESRVVVAAVTLGAAAFVSSPPLPASASERLMLNQGGSYTGDVQSSAMLSQRDKLYRYSQSPSRRPSRQKDAQSQSQSQPAQKQQLHDGVESAPVASPAASIVVIGVTDVAAVLATSGSSKAVRVQMNRSRGPAQTAVTSAAQTQAQQSTAESSPAVSSAPAAAESADMRAASLRANAVHDGVLMTVSSSGSSSDSASSGRAGDDVTASQVQPIAAEAPPVARPKSPEMIDLPLLPAPSVVTAQSKAGFGAQQPASDFDRDMKDNSDDEAAEDNKQSSQTRQSQLPRTRWQSNAQPLSQSLLQREQELRSQRSPQQHEQQQKQQRPRSGGGAVMSVRISRSSHSVLPPATSQQPSEAKDIASSSSGARAGDSLGVAVDSSGRGTATTAVPVSGLTDGDDKTKVDGGDAEIRHSGSSSVVDVPMLHAADVWPRLTKPLDVPSETYLAAYLLDLVYTQSTGALHNQAKYLSPPNVVSDYLGAALGFEQRLSFLPASMRPYFKSGLSTPLDHAVTLASGLASALLNPSSSNNATSAALGSLSSHSASSSASASASAVPNATSATAAVQSGAAVAARLPAGLGSTLSRIEVAPVATPFALLSLLTHTHRTLLRARREWGRAVGAAAATAATLGAIVSAPNSTTQPGQQLQREASLQQPRTGAQPRPPVALLVLPCLDRVFAATGAILAHGIAEAAAEERRREIGRPIDTSVFYTTITGLPNPSVAANASATADSSASANASSPAKPPMHAVRLVSATAAGDVVMRSAARVSLLVTAVTALLHRIARECGVAVLVTNGVYYNYNSSVSSHGGSGAGGSASAYSHGHSAQVDTAQYGSGAAGGVWRPKLGRVWGLGVDRRLLLAPAAVALGYADERGGAYLRTNTMKTLMAQRLNISDNTVNSSGSSSSGGSGGKSGACACACGLIKDVRAAAVDGTVTGNALLLAVTAVPPLATLADKTPQQQQQQQQQPSASASASSHAGVDDPAVVAGLRAVADATATLRDDSAADRSDSRCSCGCVSALSGGRARAWAGVVVTTDERGVAPAGHVKRT